MTRQDRLDRHTGSVAALESAFALLVLHLERSTALDRQALISDFEALSKLTGKDDDVWRAEQRMLRLLQALP